MRNLDQQVEVDGVYGWWTVLREIPRERGTGHNRNRRYECRCKCGAVKNVEGRHLLNGRSTKCNRWCPEVPRKEKPQRGPGPKYGGLASGGSRKAGNIRPYDVWCGLRRRDVICDKWKNDFPSFLEYYLEVGGFELSDFKGPNVPWSYHKVTRSNEEEPFGPGNMVVVAFRTERAWHEPTYKYWRKLSKQGILDDEMKSSYVLFLNTFGIKERGHLLSRKDITQPHSLQNSEWIRTKRSNTT